MNDELQNVEQTADVTDYTTADEEYTLEGDGLDSGEEGSVEYATTAEKSGDEERQEIDFEGELARLGGEFPSVKLSGGQDRYRQLRSLGLTPKEAYFAIASSTHKADTLSHLRTAIPRMAKSPVSAMSVREMNEARELFPNLSDRQIENLYRTVTK